MPKCFGEAVPALKDRLSCRSARVSFPIRLRLPQARPVCIDNCFALTFIQLFQIFFHVSCIFKSTKVRIFIYCPASGHCSRCYVCHYPYSFFRITKCVKMPPFTDYTAYKANASHSMSSAATPGNAASCPRYFRQKQNRRNESVSEPGCFPSPYPTPSGQ